MVTFVSHLLEPRIATMTMMATVELSRLLSFPNAAVVDVTLTQSLVLPTRSLDPDTGRQSPPHSVLKKAVAVKVSGEKLF